MAVACTSVDPGPSPTDAPGEYAAIYFFDGHALIPEFERLPSTDPVAGLMQLLGEGSGGNRLNFVGKGVLADVSEREGDGQEQLVIQLEPDFWSQPPGEVYAAAAQIVYTLATLEGGKSILLLDGTIPGEILDGSFEPIQQPLDREDFADVTPWIEVTQPPAGSSIGHEVSVLVRSRSQRVTVEIMKGERSLASGVVMDGPVTLEIDPQEPAGDVELVVTVSSGRVNTHTVTVPLELSP